MENLSAINISLIIIQINLDVDLAVPSISFVYRFSAYKPSVTLSVNHRRFRLLKRDYSVLRKNVCCTRNSIVMPFICDVRDTVMCSR